MSKKLIELGGFDTIPAISTGNLVEDNMENVKLYQKLLKDGEKNGFYPVFLKNDYPCDYFWIRLEDRGVKSEDGYKDAADNILRDVYYNCFEVWLGRMLYDYSLAFYKNKEDVDRYMEKLEPPVSNDYNELFSQAEVNQYYGIYDEDEVKTKYAKEHIHFEEFAIALLPIKNPWEALAWFQMGSFNLCPSTKCQIALAKELYEKYGARIMFIGLDRLTYYLENPLLKKEEIESAAKTLIIADGDIYTNCEDAVKEIIGRHTWQLWWD